MASIPYPVPDESKADKTDIDDLRREIGKLANEAKGTRRHSKASKEVADEVRAQMELFRADRTGLVDYAMFSGVVSWVILLSPPRWPRATVR